MTNPLFVVGSLQGIWWILRITNMTGDVFCLFFHVLFYFFLNFSAMYDKLFFVCSKVRHEQETAHSTGTVEYTDCFSAEGKTPPQRVSWIYNSKQSDCEASVMVELWGMRNTPSLPSFPGPLCPRVVAPDKVLYMDQIERNCVLILNWIARNRTVIVCYTDFFLNRTVFDIYRCVKRKLYLY